MYKHDVSGRLTSITAADGQIYQYRYDRAGNLLAISTEVTAPPAIAEPRESGIARVVEIDLSGGTPLGGHTYHARGLPKGLSIDPQTGMISGLVDSAPGEYSITYWSQVGKEQSELRTFILKVEGLPVNIVGSFAALIRDDVTNEPAGIWRIKTTSRGGFTGVLLTADGRRTSLKGRLTIPAKGADATAQVSLKPGAEEFSRLFQLSVSEIGAATGVVNFGTGGAARGTSDGALLASSARSAVPWAGTYGLLLEQSEWTPNTPDGAGYAVANVLKNGAMRLSGKLADGTPLTASVAPGSTRRYDVFAQPYRRTASYLGGVLHVKQAQDGSHFAEGTEGSALSWLKAANPRHKSYRDGFGPLGIDPSLLPWTPPQDLVAAVGLQPDAEFGAILWGGGIDSTGTAILPIGSASLPSDAFAERPAIGVGGGVVVGSNRAATKEEGEPAHASFNAGGASVWWRWTAPASGSVTVETTGSDFDTLLAVYTGEALASLSRVAANDNISTFPVQTTSAVTFNATAGTTYHIVVDGKQATNSEGVVEIARGNIKLSVAAPRSAERPNRFGVPAILRMKAAAIETAENVPVKVSGSINRKTGVFRGKFDIEEPVVVKSRPRKVTRKIRFEGLLMGKRGPQDDFAAGFLILPPVDRRDEEIAGMVIFNREFPREKIE